MDITPREAKQKLSEIRFWYQTEQVDLETAYRLGEPYLKIYNDFAKKIAKKHGVRPGLIKHNIIYW